jgi:hypothetical protein
MSGPEHQQYIGLLNPFFQRVSPASATHDRPVVYEDVMSKRLREHGEPCCAPPVGTAVGDEDLWACGLGRCGWFGHGSDPSGLQMNGQ